MAAFRDRYGPWALVTGASAGIGAAFAHGLAARGLNLVLSARRADRLEALRSILCAAHEVDVLCVSLDLASANALPELQAAVGERQVGLLVNNAGFGASGPFLEWDRDWQRQMVRLNCEVPVLLSHAFLPPMVARRRGGLIFVASTAAYQATPWMAVYGATKAFDLHLGEALAVEMRGSGVDVLTLSPGRTTSEFHEIAKARTSATGLAMAAETVVEGALQALGRRAAVVPGLANRAMVWSGRLAPRSLVTRATGWMLARRLRAR